MEQANRSSVAGMLVAVACVVAALVPPSHAQSTDRYGTRKPACGCYVCGKLVAVTFDDKDCAGILPEDACGESLSTLPAAERQSFCDKILKTVRITSFEQSCPSYAAYCSAPPQTPPGGSGGRSGSPAPGSSTPGATTPASPPASSADGRQVPIAPQAGRNAAGTGRQATKGSTGTAAASSSPPQPASNFIPLLSVEVEPRSIPGGTRTQGTVYLGRAPGPEGVTVMLSTDRTDLVGVQASVTITHGTASAETGSAVKATFPIDTLPVQGVVNPWIRARLQGQTVQTRMSLQPARVKTADIDAPSVCDGDTKAKISYELTGPAPSNYSFKVNIGMTQPNGGSEAHATEKVAAGNSAGTLSVQLPKCRNVYQGCSVYGYAGGVHMSGARCSAP